MGINIQFAEISLTNSQTSNTATITAVDQSKTLLLLTGMKSNSDVGLTEFRRQMAVATFNSNTEIKVTRSNDDGTSAVTKTYGVWIIEDDDFNVQRGEVTTPAYPNSVTISSVTQTNSAIFVNVEGDAGSGEGKEWVPMVEFDSSTQFTMSINATYNIYGSKVWQIVECSRWTTQRLSGSGTYGSYQDVTISSVDLDKTWHIAQAVKNGSDISAKEAVYTYLTSSTNLRFDKIDTTSEYYLGCAFVIEDSAASVQRDTITVASSSLNTDTISTIDTDKAFMAVGASNLGLITPADNDNDFENKDFCLSTIENSTTVQAERYNTGVRPSYVPYEVVEITVEDILDDHVFQRGVEIGIYRGVEHAR